MDIGPVLMAKIIKKNGQVLHRCTYQTLAQEEWEQEECRAKHSLALTLAADILNAYAMAPNHEKIWTVLGPEFGDDAGKSAIIIIWSKECRCFICSTSSTTHTGVRV